MNMLTMRKCTSFLLCLLVGLCLVSCDPMYSFKFTRFGPRSAPLQGKATKVERLKMDGTKSMRVERDGITVTPVTGSNNANSVAMVVAIKNDTDSVLILDPAKITIRPTFVISIFPFAVNAKECTQTVEKVTVKSKVTQGEFDPVDFFRIKKEGEKNKEALELTDGVFRISAHTEVVALCDFGVYIWKKGALSFPLTRVDSGLEYVYEFRCVPRWRA